MLPRDLLRTAIRGVTVNRGRAFLTMLGIIIGVGSVVLMTGVGKSMEGVILGQISVLGANSMVVFPGNEGPEGGAASMRSDFDAVSFDDVEAMKKLTTIARVASIIFVPGEAQYGREKMTPTIVAATPEYYINQNMDIDRGRPHDANDEQSAQAVAIIGTDIVKDLFVNEEPLGKRFDLAGRKFTVIGVIEPLGTQFFQNADDRIVIPFSVGEELTGKSYLDMVTFEAVASLQLAQQDVENLLRQRHGIVPPTTGDKTENDDFLVRTAEQAQDILGAVSLGLTMFITMVAGISLVVGGIGIMNIMLVSVTERTREIGLRKAVGARRRDILRQFLAESVALTLLGGTIGIIGGIGFAYLIALIVNAFLDRYLFAISPGSVVVALLVSAGVGLAFGVYPAKKAASLSPMEALRYE